VSPGPGSGDWYRARLPLEDAEPSSGPMRPATRAVLATLALTQALLLALRLTGLVPLDWWTVTVPLWILPALVALVALLAGVAGLVLAVATAASVLLDESVPHRSRHPRPWRRWDLHVDPDGTGERSVVLHAPGDVVTTTRRLPMAVGRCVRVVRRIVRPGLGDRP